MPLALRADDAPATDDLHLINDHVDHLRRRGLSPATRDKRRRLLGTFSDYLGDRTLVEATWRDVQAWQQSITHLGPATQASYASHIRAFFGWCVLGELVLFDPTLRMDRIKLPRRLPRPLPPREVKRALDAAPKRIRPWIALGFYAGLRCCEIARLQREDFVVIDAQRYMRIIGKGNKERSVPVSPELWAELVRHGFPARGHLFLREDGQGGPNEPHLISILGNRYLAYQGLGTMHQLRHTAATGWARDARSLREVQEALGHSSPETTAVYTLVASKSVAKMVNRTSKRWT